MDSKCASDISHPVTGTTDMGDMPRTTLRTPDLEQKLQPDLYPLTWRSWTRGLLRHGVSTVCFVGMRGKQGHTLVCWAPCDGLGDPVGWDQTQRVPCSARDPGGGQEL